MFLAAFIAQGTLPWQPILEKKWAKREIGRLRRLGIPKRSGISQF